MSIFFHPLLSVTMLFAAPESQLDQGVTSCNITPKPKGCHKYSVSGKPSWKGKSTAEIRRIVSINISSDTRRSLNRCAPTGLDIRQIETFVTLSLEPSGRVTDVRVDKQTGINDNNRPQAEPLKRCIIQAVRAASPFKGLDPDYHDIWKTHAMRLRATG